MKIDTPLTDEELASLDFCIENFIKPRDVPKEVYDGDYFSKNVFNPLNSCADPYVFFHKHRPSLMDLFREVARVSYEAGIKDTKRELAEKLFS